MVSAVTFDVWHTLVYLEPDEEELYLRRQEDTAARVLATWRRSPRARHPPCPHPRDAARRALAGAVEAARSGRSVSLGVQAVHAARLLGRVPDPLEFARALEAIVATTEFRTAPNARSTLAELEGRGFRIGVVSNTIGEPGEALQRVLDRLGLAPHISGWAFSDQLPWAKPAPEIFLHCLGTMGVRPDRAVHVGDGPPDIRGARAAGFRAAILYTGLRRYSLGYARLFAPDDPVPDQADRIIRRLEELPDLARNLLPASG